ncbi:MAG: ABC transporter ATP-binding protein [Phycisphaerales bacterium JB060]
MLQLTNVHKRFGRVTAVDGLSLDVAPGEVMGLLGPNGAGKTTTIGMSVGLLRPDRGTVTLGTGDAGDAGGVGGVGGNPADAHVRTLVGVAPQSIALYDAMTARENLVLFARLHGLGRRDAIARAGELLERVGLADRAHHRVGGFSGGMKRRLNLAAALVAEPRLVLLDEPTAGVDPQSRHAIFDIVAGLKDAGVTVLFSTHYMEEAARLCDRVAIVDHGRMLALGTVDELIGAHGGPSMVVVRRRDAEEVRTQTSTPLEELSRLIAQHGSSIAELRVENPDLEAVFLHLTGTEHRQ